MSSSPKPFVLAIDHVQLAMPPGGEDEARRFYSGLLGLPERPKPAALAARGGAWFESASVKVHLGVEKDFRAARKAHPGLLVRDLRALVVLLRAAGHVVTEDEAADGPEHVYVDDPFGNRLELIEGGRP
jgi:catechol 2,3-dioxygenase-like lactoylglutathione lyase family enzyme